MMAILFDGHRACDISDRVAYTGLAGTMRNITFAEEEGVDANIKAFVVEAVVLGNFRG